ncbi:hypothetical protein AB0I28_12665 [Phytomonospora sp. NPDC050363]|uniref:hypothetical protein n=1 Tax=Phytomonospora sp. NPDC050363 TaxID=3155642 RepID=UPI0033C7BB9D
MTFAPEPLLAARKYIIAALGVPGAGVGIVGDSAHWGGYHCGRDRTVSGDYSVVESSRDRGPTLAAAALDVGSFSKTIGGEKRDLKHFSAWLVEQCKAGAPDTRDIREVIYSPDGRSVKRWDRLGRRNSGDDSHRYHTHISYFRDSESRDKVGLFKRYVEGEEDETMAGFFDVDDMPNRPWRGDFKSNKTVHRSFGFGAMWDGIHNLEVEAAAAKARDVAILQAVAGDVDSAAILARIDELAAAHAADLADMREWLRELVSGEVTADEVVAVIRERLDSNGQ